MGWDSAHDLSWSELERKLSGQTVVQDPLSDVDNGPQGIKREPFVGEPVERGHSEVPYAELHCHSNFSFLDGASHPGELVHEAVRLGLEGLALTDHDGLYGAVRFALTAREHELPTVFGAELGLSGVERAGPADPAGTHLLLLARGNEGYQRLSTALSKAHLAGGVKGRPLYDMSWLSTLVGGHVAVLTGCRKGAVPQALVDDGDDAALWELDRLTDLFGEEHVVVELTDHGNPLDVDLIEALARLADRRGLRTVATNNVHYHAPQRRRLATLTAAVRARSSLDDIDPHLPAASTAHLRSGDEMAARFGALLGPSGVDAVRYAAELAGQLAFELDLVKPKLPPYPVTDGHTEASWLRHLAREGAKRRYGNYPEAMEKIEYELDIIEQLGYPGYFLVVYDIVEFCYANGILCQGRGSAANSAVCYALRITNVDPVKHRLLFERFLAPEREGPPDIDVDIESDRREEVIQHVYTKYGREYTAQVANVISYRPRSAVRDVARAFGYSPGQQDAWSKQIDRWSGQSTEDLPPHVVHYADQLLETPRHLGIHSGGMVICDRPVTQVCPVEWARMPERTVLQWDKDDCADAYLVKFDLLGLGMLSAIRYAYEFIGLQWDEDELTCDDPEVYKMLCRADAVGVFQVESRAQMATLPRLRPSGFYDLVVEVALIRPGPIQGGSVHPYLRRRHGEEFDYPHPLMVNALSKTLGVPLFQEQMMQLAIDVANFTPKEADQLRRAMSAKRSEAKMARLKERLYEGMAANGIPPATADDIYNKLLAFANYGFPESHAISFAYLAYKSAWLKRYYPAAFLAGLLGAQPMGFYSPQSLVDDARRHGVLVLRPCINASSTKATLEDGDPFVMAGGPGTSPSAWGVGGPSVRLGLDQVQGLGEKAVTRIVAARQDEGEFKDMFDLVRRCELSRKHMESLALADAFGCFGLERREALWVAGSYATETPDRLPGTATGTVAPRLPGMDDTDRLVADVEATGLSPDSHPIHLVRSTLDGLGAVPIDQLAEMDNDSWVLVGGLVTHRQRPGTARGVTFINLEDETGMLNVVCTQRVWRRYRKAALFNPALVIQGKLENTNNVVNVVAAKLSPLTIAVRPTSRDFR